MELVNTNTPEERVDDYENTYEFKTTPKLAQKIKGYLTTITIEPVIALYILPNIMAGLTMQNLTLEKACRVNLKLNGETCNALTSRNASVYTKDEEIVVQQVVASMYTWKVVLQSIIPALLLLFLGSWSDRHRRRKPFILLPVLGGALTCFGYLLCTYFFYELPMEFNGISEALPLAITGGWYTMFMASYSYVADTCSVENRTGRIGIIHILIDVSITLGVALSGVIFQATHFYGVFTLCLVLTLSGVIYGFYRINENSESGKSASDVNHNKLEAVKDFLDVKHVKETFLVVFKNGQNNRRIKICLIFFLAIVTNGPLHGEMGVMYLYVRFRFHWDEIDYSVYATYKVVLQLLGTALSLFIFTKCLKLSDSLIGLISTTSRILSCFVYAFAPIATIFYLGPAVDILSGISPIAVRSIITKLVLRDELGKVNSIYGVCEALLPLLYGPMYSMLYTSTIKILPGTFFLVGGLLTFPAMIIFGWFYLQQKRAEREEQDKRIEF